MPLSIWIAWTLSGSAHAAPPAPTAAPAFDLDGVERVLDAGETPGVQLGALLVAGLIESGALPPGCAGPWLAARQDALPDPDPVMARAFLTGICPLPCASFADLALPATAAQAKCRPDRFGAAPPAEVSAAAYLQAVLVVDAVRARLDADDRRRTRVLRARFDALVPRMLGTLVEPEPLPTP